MCRIVRKGTYAEFKDDNDGKDSPDRVLANVIEGFLEEDEDRNEGESETHLKRENDLSGIRATHLIGVDGNLNDMVAESRKFIP